ncbi:MAG: aminoacyl-histidine dipeptidase [Tannerella sp.]|jgi:dipeptidase D|nr:aminoacyl-histidine dipeptidase [Tannerella sp.]
MTIKDLEPKIVWKYFDEITQVPRPSKKEEKIAAYIESVAAANNIPCKRDKAGNILLTKAASKGFEHLPTVVLQAHLDMVCEKNGDVKHDFDNDPLKTVVEGEWLRAEGTTLGADNGIGVAAALAVVTSDDVKHGPVECLFTVDEETGLTGANALEKGFFTGKILLNLDSEDEGEIFIGCAGGKNTSATFYYGSEPAPEELSYFRISVKGLRGGHSGCDIHLGRGNAIKILARFLSEEEPQDILCSFEGGNLHNAIPREASAVIGIVPDRKESVRVQLNNFAATVENELKHSDKDVQLTMESVEKPDYYIIEEDEFSLIKALVACPHGVLGMSSEIEGLVETSTNLASVKIIDDETIEIVTSQRSSVGSLKQAASEMVAAVFELAEATVEHGDGYPGWAPDRNSKILKVAQESYKRLFGKEAAIKAIHAGLECGLFLEKYPDLDMISFGPTLRGVHSPDERIEIKTVAMWWEHLKDILVSI